eukprot:7542532-Karenia_brevis.AAC.1
MDDRRRSWAPVAQHSHADNGARAITGWMEEWSCRTCNHTITPQEIGAQANQPMCDRCHSWMAWIFDVSTSLGEWRCVRCDHACFARPVRQCGVASASNADLHVATGHGPTRLLRRMSGLLFNMFQ